MASRCWRCFILILHGAHKAPKCSFEAPGQKRGSGGGVCGGGVWGLRGRGEGRVRAAVQVTKPACGPPVRNPADHADPPCPLDAQKKEPRNRAVLGAGRGGLNYFPSPRPRRVCCFTFDSPVLGSTSLSPYIIILYSTNNPI